MYERRWDLALLNYTPRVDMNAVPQMVMSKAMIPTVMYTVSRSAAAILAARCSSFVLW